MDEPPSSVVEYGASFIVFVLLLAASAFFSASETALIGANRVRLHHAAHNGDRRARRVLRLIENPGLLLSAILIGNNVVNTAAAALVTPLFGPLAATIIVVPLLLVFSEITPKTIAAMYPDKLALRVAPFVSLLRRVLAPAVWATETAGRVLIRAVLGELRSTAERDRLTLDEIRTSLELGRRAGTVTGGESSMLRGVLSLRDTTADELAIPADRLRTLPIRGTVADLMHELAHSRHTRYPLVDERGRVVGLLHVKDVFVGGRPPDSATPLRRFRRDMHFAPPDTPAGELLHALQRARTHMAGLRAADGNVTGFVALEDIIESIVGTIQDEHDTDVPAVVAIPGGFRVRPTTLVRDVNVLTDLHIPEADDYETVGEFVEHIAGTDMTPGIRLGIPGGRVVVAPAAPGQGMCIDILRRTGADLEPIDGDPAPGGLSGVHVIARAPALDA